MTTSKSVEAKIKEVIESRGLQQKFICEKIKTVEFLAVCSLLGLNFSDFEECQ